MPPDSELPDDEIEIIEIVGLDEDSPAARPRRAKPPLDEVATEADADDDDEVVVELDDDTVVAFPPELPIGAPDVSEEERLLRLTADFDNFKKRVEREREAQVRHAGAQLVTRLLPVLDNFERALSAAGQAGNDPAFHDGIALIFRQLLDELRKEGLSAVYTVGELFDPEVHEAVATTTDPGLPPNTVVEELQRGYLLHERLLRPALVRVNLDSASGTEDAAGDEEA
jgi:molecular chaperone GrpE